MRITGSWILLKCHYKEREVNLHSIFGKWKEELEYWAKRFRFSLKNNKGQNAVVIHRDDLVKYVF